MSLRAHIVGLLSSSALAVVADLYAIGGNSPKLVFDFDDEYYRTGGSATTFDSAISHNSTTAQNGTMVDSDGLIKWRPHNFLLNTENVATSWSQSDANNGTKTGASLSISDPEGYVYITCGIVSPFVVGVKYKIEFDATCDSSISNVPFRVGDFINSSLVTFSAGETKTISIEVTASNTGITAKIGIDARNAIVPGGSNETGYNITISKPRMYRSDLGGMVDNPDTGNSYVPTTTNARYLPRRGHHVYNGSTWVNEGLLVESEARTNLVVESEDFNGTGWNPVNSIVTTTAGIAPDGTNTANKLTDDNTSGTVYVARSTTVSTNTAYVYSFFAKAGNRTWTMVQTIGFTTPANGQVYFDLASGAVGTVAAGRTADIIPVGNGWYRCWVSFTTDASDTLGQIQTFVADADGDSTIAFDGTAHIFLWGAQFEQGSTPSSYIPNYGTPSGVTRGAETLTVAAADLPYPTVNVIGSELVTNGTFDTDISGWTVGTNITASVNGSGQVEVTRTAASISPTAAFEQVLTLESGKLYQLSVDVVVNNGAAFAIADGSSAAYTGVGPQTFNGTGVKTYKFFATDTVGQLNFWSNDGTTSTFDNISVREIDPLSVSIQMDGRVTFADTDVASSVDGGVGEAVFHLWKYGTSAYIETVLDTDNGTGMASFVQEGGGARDIVSSTGSYYTPGILVPYNISSRHGSTFINGATDGVEIGEDVTPTALPDLSATDLSLAYDYMGTIRTFRMWDVDLGNTGIESAST